MKLWPKPVEFHVFDNLFDAFWNWHVFSTITKMKSADILKLKSLPYFMKNTLKMLVPESDNTLNQSIKQFNKDWCDNFHDSYSHWGKYTLLYTFPNEIQHV